MSKFTVFPLEWMESFLFEIVQTMIMIMEENVWLNVRNAAEKLHRQEKHGRWLVAQTETVRELS